MRKIKLVVETLEVQSFVISAASAARGTVAGHQATQGGPNCGSAYDACQTGLCTFDCDPTYSPEACPTQYPQYC
ncbi:MAG: hypothetical protein ACJ8GN_16795 [Longimicrobiaceae bacterium]